MAWAWAWGLAEEEEGSEGGEEEALSMMRVFTTSMGVVMTAAMEPAILADIAVIVVFSNNEPLEV